MPNVGSRRIQLLGAWNADGTVTGVTATQASNPVDCDGRGYITIYLRSVGATTGGTVLIEEADYGPTEGVYSGTWGQVSSIAANTFTGTVELPVHLPVAAYGFIRVRISSTITGGGSILVSMRDLGVS